MRLKVFLLQKSQNTAGLEVKFDLDQPEPLDDAKALTHLEKTEEDSAPVLCYYSPSSEPLIAWLMLVCDFVVIVDPEFVPVNIFPGRYDIPSMQFRELLALVGSAESEARGNAIREQAEEERLKDSDTFSSTTEDGGESEG